MRNLMKSNLNCILNTEIYFYKFNSFYLAIYDIDNIKYLNDILFCLKVKLTFSFEIAVRICEKKSGLH